MIFIWDEFNEAHIGEHGISPAEAMQVVRAAEPPFPQLIEGAKRLVWGRTDAGRFLQVIYALREPDTIDLFSLGDSDRLALEDGEEARYILHARDMTDSEKRQLRRRRR